MSTPPPPPQASLYNSEDFGEGIAEGWTLEQGWQVSRQDGEFVLHGQGGGQATFGRGGTWTDHAFKFRLKVLAGRARISYRLTEGARTTRYFFSFTEQGLISLRKQVGEEFTLIGRARRFRGSDTWHTVEVRGFEGHLRVIVDGVTALDMTDEAPVLQGTIAFEAPGDSEVLVDDIEVLALTDPLRGLPPSSSLASRRSSVLEYAEHPLANASLITIGAPGLDGVTLVTGGPGSVPPLVFVAVATVEYAHGVTVASAADGSFIASVIAAPGATIHIRWYPHFGPPIGDPGGIDNHWPGTLMRVADSPDGGGGTPFSGAGSTAAPSGGDPAVFWAVAGTVVQPTLGVGETVTVSGSVRVYVPAGVTAPPSVTVLAHLGIDPMFDAGGGQVAPGSDFISRILTPTGLPIERHKGPGFTDIHQFELSLQDQSGALVASFDTTVSLPASLPPGTHRLYLWISAEPELEQLTTEPSTFQDHLLGFGGATVALLTVGAPGAPRLSPALLVDSPNQGVRGTIATEERGRYELADRVATQLDGFVVEPRDRATGQLIPYRLEPFFPFISNADRFLPNAPLVPLDLPGGSLTVTVHTPSGETDELGTHPILQTRTGLAATQGGGVLDAGGGNPSAVLQLTTLSDAFLYRFAEYGRYTVTISGSVPDIWAREYPFAGTFEIWSAETLDVETASLPTTPFQVGDRLPAVVNVYPGVPAQVEMSFELHPIDGSAVVADSVAGTANRFGYFDGAGKAFEMTEAGEYLVSLRASYTDAEGRLWIGARRWGSGVASASPVLIAHGRRGRDNLPSPSEARAWFSDLSTGRVADDQGHISFPYHSGDIIWATNEDATQPRITVQDPEGRIADLLEERAHQSSYEGPDVERRRVTGDLPLILSTRTGVDAMFDPGTIDQWGYAYRAAQRPGVRVREQVGTDAGKSPYWGFNDLFVAQRGMGIDGDLPNDIKWLFGAAVFKRPDLGIGEVAIYGSLWVLISDEDPVGSRVFPAFQGATGGPSGGPIMTLNGQEIDLFLMPTAVRPGTVLEVGDRFVFAGQVGPPMASKVTVRVTSPGGQVRTINGQANSIGYFSDPAGDFVVDEAGIWTVDVEVVHDGLTSAGPVEPPYPTGGVLGSADGRFQVYVVPRAAALIDFGLHDISLYALRFDGHLPRPLRFFPRIPEGWSDVDGVYTISMPGFILEEGTLEPGEEGLEIVYDPVRLHEDFPNIDLRERGGGGPGLSDEVFISVLLSGTDASGQRVRAAKVITLVGEDIYNLN